MLDEKMLAALNKQINEELASAYIYLSMAADFEDKGLKGFGQWMQLQSQEEVSHAMKIYNYINDRGGKVELTAIAAPQKTWDNALKVFETTLAHEQHITGCIHKLVDLAIELKDHATNAFLQWFVSEQVEEEVNAGEILDKLKLVGQHTNGIFMLDRELGRRQE